MRIFRSTPTSEPPALPESDATQSTLESFGLQVLHEPRTCVPTAKEDNGSTKTKTVGIIFVHGLGGSMKKTWTHRSANAFWPMWLPEEKDIGNIQISTFGYDANFKNVIAPRNALGIPDFAKQFLDCLDLYYHQHGDVLSSFNETDTRHLLFLLDTVWADW